MMNRLWPFVIQPKDLEKIISEIELDVILFSGLSLKYERYVRCLRVESHNVVVTMCIKFVELLGGF